MCAFRGRRCQVSRRMSVDYLDGRGGGLPSMFVSCSVRMYAEDNANNFLFQRRSRKELSRMISWFGPALLFKPLHCAGLCVQSDTYSDARCIKGFKIVKTQRCSTTSKVHDYREQAKSTK